MSRVTVVLDSSQYRGGVAVMVKTLVCAVITVVFTAGLIGCGGGGGGTASPGERITITAEFPAEGEGAEETITSAWVTVTADGMEPLVQEMTYDAVNYSATTAITVPVGTNYTIKVDAKTSADVIVFTGEGTGVQVVAGVPVALAIPMAKPPADTVAPVLSNATVTPLVLPKEGGIVTLSVDVADNTGATAANAVVTLPDNNTVTVSLTDGGTGTWTGTYTAEPNATLEDLSYTVTFTASDAAGNESDPVVVTFTVPLTPDTVAPVLSNAKVEPSVLSSEGGLVTLSVYVSDNAGATSGSAVVTLPDNNTATVDLTFKSGDAKTGTWEGTYTAGPNATLEDLSYTVIFTARDGSGNESDPVVVTFTVPLTPDSVAPVLSNAKAEPSVLPKEGGLVTLSVDATDNTGATSADAVVTLPDNSQVTVGLTDNGTGTWTGTYTTGPNATLEDLSYTVIFTARDGSGNESSPASVTFTVPLTPDSVAPVLSNAKVEPSSLPEEGGMVALRVDAADANGVTSANAVVTLPDNSTETVSLTDGGTGTWTGIYTATANDTSEDQSYTVTFTGEDEAGNVSNPVGMSFAVQAATAIDYSKMTLFGSHSAGYPVNSVAFSPDGNTLAIGRNKSGDGIILFDARTLTMTSVLGGEFGWGHRDGHVLSVAFSPDSNTLASGANGIGDNLKLWDAQTGALKFTLTGHNDEVRCVAFSPDGSTLASASWNKHVNLWDVMTGERKRSVNVKRRVDSVAFSPDGSTFATGSYDPSGVSHDENLQLWDGQTGEWKRTLTGHLSDVKSVAFSPDGRTLASGSYDETVKLWDIQTGALIRTFAGGANSVAFSPDGRTLASAARGNYIYEIKLWDVQTGELQNTLSDAGPVKSVVFSPDGMTLASGSTDNRGEVKFWRVP